jgi:hypothetical protein
MRKLPNREKLRRLLHCGLLTPSQTRSVQQMANKLGAGGTLIRSQVAWIDLQCQKWGLDVRWSRPRRRTDTKSYKAMTSAAFDALPRPKQPPGRR